MATRRTLTVWVSLALVALLGAACSTDQSDGADGSEGASVANTCQAASVVDEPLLVANTGQAGQDVSYAAEPQVPQAVDCDGMRQFVSQPQPGFSLQSWVFYGHLTAQDGKVIAFSTLTQRGPSGLSLPLSSVETAAVTVNAGDGTILGGVEGVANDTVAVSSTSNPWSRRVQTTTSGAAPQFIDARVVQGQLGEPGAVIELTAQVAALDPNNPSTPVPLQVVVRARDVAGVGQWGYGPSGFFPQWLTRAQNDGVTNQFGGSVADYLAATGDPMVNQGSNYYSSPVLDVLQFVITKNGEVIHYGTEGELLADYVTQTYDANGVAVLGAGVSWTEFSVLLDDQRTMKIGEVKTTGSDLPYAVMLDAAGTRGDNGSLVASMRWDVGQIAITADPGSGWTSPASGKTYQTRYTVALGDDADLTLTAVYDDQEIDALGRTVYEGLYSVTGTINGESVTGLAWAEVQPSGSLG